MITPVIPEFADCWITVLISDPNISVYRLDGIHAVDYAEYAVDYPNEYESWFPTVEVNGQALEDTMICIAVLALRARRLSSLELDYLHGKSPLDSLR